MLAFAHLSPLLCRLFESVLSDALWYICEHLLTFLDVLLVPRSLFMPSFTLHIHVYTIDLDV